MPELLAQPTLESNAQLLSDATHFPGGDALVEFEQQAVVEPIGPYAPRHAAEKLSLRERITQTRLGRKIGASVAALTVAITGLALETSPAVADNSQEYTIADTAAGGVYSRNSPRMGDTPRIAGKGIYPGDIARLICGITDGEAYGPNNNTTWHKIINLSRPEHGEFWENDRFFNTPNKPGELAPGEKNCNEPSSGGQPAEKAKSKITSVFYSPNTNPHGIDRANGADLNLTIDKWSAGDCAPELAAKVPAGVDTLAGWSVGRLGPVYFLEKATDEQKNDLRTIILFDPGASSDMDKPSFAKQLAGKNTCDWRYDINGLLSDWLSSNKENRLFVMTGRDSEMKTDPGNPGSHSTFQGLWKHYFAGLWNKDFADRAKVCDYNNMDHATVLDSFSEMIDNPPENCPISPNSNHPLTQWHP
jgi:hypothetical protein